MAYERKDHFYRRAKREGKVSRAAYKITELQKRFRLAKKGDIVLDLGCAPGGWLQEIATIVGPTGKVIGVDLLPLKKAPPAGCHFICRDLTDPLVQDDIVAIAGGTVDVVLSDMSPNLSGVWFADAFRSYELAALALAMCERFLRDGGNFAVKIFPGDEFPAYVAELKRRFRNVAAVTPEATRRTSSERYVVARGFRRKPPG